MTTGRNQPCPCGSGKKFKRCHGALPHEAPPNLAIEVDAARRAMEAERKLRERAEGHGRPVISTDFKGYQLVAVGNKLYHGQGWRFFTDFLLFHMKEVLGRGWGKRMASQGDAHPLMRWLRRMGDGAKRTESPEGKVLQADGSSVAMAVFRFAYALYLIAHHDKIPSALIRRLRHPSEFLAAVVETIAFATFAVAGSKLEMGETGKAIGPEGEFKATSPKSGKTYSVEAKRKAGWRSPVELANPEFRRELIVWVERKLRAASAKGLDNPIFWFELSLPTVADRQQAEDLHVLVREALRSAETRIIVGGKVPTPAYVFVTSHGFLAGGGDTCLYMLEGFHIPMRVKGEVVDIEEALVERDRDRDVTWILDCLQKVQTIPHHFDGTPDDLVGPDHKPIDRLKIGQRVEIALPNEPSVRGLVTHVTSHGQTAAVVIMDEATGEQTIVEVPLTEDEQRATAALGDIVFGNPDGVTRVPDDDPLGIYDFFLKSYAHTPRETLLGFIKDHREASTYSRLPTEELRTRVCREWAKSAIGHAATKRPLTTGGLD